MKRILAIMLIAFLCNLICVSSSWSQSFWDRFKDPKDGKFDVSGWSEEEEATGGFLPVPIIISEPALGGFGLGASMLYLREKGDYENADSKSDKKNKERPPSISGIGAAYTLNDSWFVGIGHVDNWINDTLRYTGGLGYASLNLDFYGSGQQGFPNDGSLAFNIKGLFLIQDLKYRLFKSDIFAGGRYTFLSSDVTFDISTIIPGLPPTQGSTSDGGLGPVFQYDTRDNIFTPTKGSRVDLTAMFHDPNFGGDFTYQSYRASGLTWFGVHPKVTLGLRLDGRSVKGDPPFYAVPYIELRGIRALRYQGDVAVMGEIEAKWQAFNRWSMIGFVGSGRAAESFDTLDNTPGRHTFGAGFRYFIARKFGMHAGVDVARGPEDTYVYIQIGSAWSR